MMFTVVMTFIISLVVFILLLVIVHMEKVRGQRFFAVSLRGWLDKQVDKIGEWLVVKTDHFIKYILQLHWYYSIHSVLRTILKVMVAFYSYIENIFERNRARTKQLRLEKRNMNTNNHLQKMTVHKESTALTPAQQRKLKQKKLAGK